MFRAAVCRGNLGIVQWMIEGGISPKSLPPIADSLHDIVSRFVLGNDGGKFTLLMITYLVEEGKFDVSRPRKTDGWTPLHIAAQRNLVVAARHLVGLGADVNAVGKDDMMPLNLADRIAKMLQPAKVNKFNSDSDSDKEEEEEEEDGNKEEIKEEDAKDNGARKNEATVKTNTEDVQERSTTTITDNVDPPLTPLQQILIDKGARRTWRRQQTVQPVDVKKKKPAVAVRFSGGFTSEQASSESVVQRADGGFTISCD
jgi:hypothetical protein